MVYLDHKLSKGGTNSTMEERIHEIISYYQNQTYQTQAQRTYDMLLEMIALDALPEKSIYTEAELTQMLQIGRTPLRDALKLLEFDSITRTIPRLGIQVCEVRIEDYYLQTEVRTALEIVVIQRACQLAPVDLRDRLAQLNRDFTSTAAHGDRLALYRIDRNIHNIIDECSKNPYAVHALAPLRFFEQRIHYLLNRVYPEIGDVLNREHIDYVNGIINGECHAACAHFQNMVDNTTRLIKRQVDAHLGLPFANH